MSDWSKPLNENMNAWMCIKRLNLALFQVYTYSGLLLLILLAEFGAGIAALVHTIYFPTIHVYIR